MNETSTSCSILSHECTFQMRSNVVGDLYTLFTCTAVLMSLLIPPTILLNAVVIVGIYKTPSLHSPSNVLLCGMALTDLGAGAVAMPIFVIVSVAYATNSPSLWCDVDLLSKVLVTPFSGVSFVTLTLISLDRMIALQFHMRYTSIVTNRRVVSALVVVWIAAFFISSSHLWNVKIMEWSTVGIFTLCLITCSFNNAIIFRILHRHRVAIAHQQQQVQLNQSTDNINMAQRRKTSSTMLWVYLLFILCYAPFLAVRVLRNFYGKNTKALYIAFSIPYTIMYVNSLLNPVLYCIKMRPIRKAVFGLIPTKLRCCMRLNVLERDVHN